MPSDFQKILMDLQKDLNAITISALAANNALSRMLQTCDDADPEFSPYAHAQHTQGWAKALNSLTDSLENFGKDGNRLREYIDGKR